MALGIKKQQDGEKRLTLFEHLLELRQRFIYSAIALVITIVISLFFTDRLVKFLIAHRPTGVPVIAIDVTEPVAVWFKVSLYLALAMAMPFFIYQVVMFIHPALHRKEKRYLYVFLPAATLLFFAGVAYTWFAFLPPALQLLLNFGNSIGITTYVRFSSLIGFEVKAIFWLGLAFELPVVTFVLAKIGILNHRLLAKHWKLIVIGAILISGIITPTGNPLRQSIKDIILLDFGFIVSGPILLLYLVGIFTAWLGQRKKSKS